MKIMHATLVVLAAGLLVGSESGAKTKAPQRILKMDVEVGQIAAQPITLPSGEVINFPYIANALFYRSIMGSDHFTLTTPVPSPQQYVAPKANSMAMLKAMSEVDDESMTSIDPSLQGDLDQQLLSQYKFLKPSAPVSNQRGIEGKALSLKSERVSVPDSEIPLCFYNLPQSQIKGEVVSFEATFGIGLGIGYGAGGAPVNSGGVAGSVKFNQSRLDVGIRAEDPLDGRAVAQAGGVSNQSTINLGINFGLGIPIGLDLFFKTPLAKVVSTAFDKALTKIIGDFERMSDLGTWEDAWESRVLYDPDISDNDTYIAFRGGINYGMKKGDTFVISNMIYKWEREPCSSRLKYRIPRTATPIAEVEVINLGNNVAVAKVTKYLIEQRIEPGAQVKLLKYFVAPPKPKK